MNIILSFQLNTTYKINLTNYKPEYDLYASVWTVDESYIAASLYYGPIKINSSNFTLEFDQIDYMYILRIVNRGFKLTDNKHLHE